MPVVLGAPKSHLTKTPGGIPKTGENKAGWVGQNKQKKMGGNPQRKRGAEGEQKFATCAMILSAASEYLITGRRPQNPIFF